MPRGIPSSVVRYFQRVPLFSDLSKRGVRRVVQAATEIDEPEGTVLVREGDLGRELYVLVSGSARVSRKGRRIAEMGPGDFFGELAFLSHAPRTATVTATSDSRLMILGPRELEVLLRAEPRIGIKMLDVVARRLREVESAVTH
ncbi:MAG: cyclic nucleotide-binding domain-containing protein [Actinomycetota bacterium]